MLSKKSLAIQLSKLEPLQNFKINLEQYQTESEMAAEILWWAYMNGDIKNKIIADFACGNGIFGHGAKLLGAKKVYFVDIDEEAIEIAKKNSKGEFLCIDINNFSQKVDTVLMNPPFGVQKRKADKQFLEKAMALSHSIYSIHKIESKKFIEALTNENGFEMISILEKDFLLRKIYDFHKKRRYPVKVGCWHLRKL